MKYKVGDEVIVNDNYYVDALRSKVGKILCVVKEDAYDYVVQFDEKISLHTHRCYSYSLGVAIDFSERSRFFIEDEISLCDKNLEKIRNKQREKLKKKMKDIDPFEEEDWLEEKVEYTKKLKKYKEFKYEI